MTTDDVATTETPLNETNATAIRWWPCPASLVEGILLQLATTVTFSENFSYLVFVSLFIVWPLIVFQLLLWWTFWSRMPWTTRWRGLGIVAGGFVLFVSLFRFDEFDGAMIPRFSWRWRPTARIRAEAFFKQRQTKSEPATTESNEAPAAAMTDEDWPEFRGPRRDDVLSSASVRTDFDSRSPKLLWRQPIGLGWGTFSVVGDRAFTIEQRGPQEFTVCYDTATGREIWSHQDEVRFESVQGGNGPRSTPTLYDDRVYALGATGLLNCLSIADGKLIWSRQALEDAGKTNLPWGQAGSPLIVDRLVIVSPGSNDKSAQAKNSAVIAYDRQTGERVWSAGDRYGSYASPQLATLSGVPQVLVFDGRGLLSVAPTSGEILWSFAWENTPQINAAQPMILDDHTVLIGSGYNLGAACLTVTHGSEPSAWTVSSKWTSKQFKLKFNSAVRHGDFVYGLDEGVLTCLSLSDGQRRWKQGRYGYGQLQLVGDTLLILAESGDVVFVPAQPDSPRELARFHAIDGKTWNHPVLNRGRLLVRNSDEAACYDLR